jgi:hypothetical protein
VPKGVRKPTGDRGREILSKMDQAATALLKLDDKTTTLQTRLEVFSAVAKWMGVRNRITELESEHDGLLGDYKLRLAGNSRQPGPEGSAPAREDLPRRPERVGPGREIERPSANDYGGAELEALKQRLPKSDERRVDGDGLGRGGAGVIAPGADGEFRVDLGGAKREPDPYESGNLDDF